MKAVWTVLKALLSSKKFAAVIVGWVVILAAKIGLDLSPTDVAEMVGMLTAYIIGQGVSDHGKEAAKLNNSFAAELNAKGDGK